MLPKIMSDSLIRKLNKACNDIGMACDMKCDEECDNMGWCEACWILVGSGEADRHPKAAVHSKLERTNLREGGTG